LFDTNSLSSLLKRHDKHHKIFTSRIKNFDSFDESVKIYASILSIFEMEYKTSFRGSIADCFLLALAEKESAIVISTDHHEFDVIDNRGELAFYWLRG